MPLSHPSHLFSPYSKARVSRTFPPITNQLSLTPERSPSPPYLTLNRTFSVSVDEGADCISNAGVTVVQSASRQSSSHSPLSSDNNCPEPYNSNIEPSSDSEGIPENRKIPKPKGEVGHPGGNGYSLSNELKWDKTVYEAVQKGVHRLADAHLNNNFGISKQDDKDIWIVLKKANQEFPILRKYVAYWPAQDMVKLYLKTSSERARWDLPPSTRKDDLAHALVILGKAQLVRDAFDSRQLPIFLANINDGNVPEMLDFQDIGIDWASEIFVRQSHAKIEDVTGFVEKYRAIEAITELTVKEPGDFRYAPMNFENIWNMVDVLKQQQLDRDGLYLLIYFLALANCNSTIPPSLPRGIRNLMLEERDEILARATVNSRLFTLPASERHQENMTSPIILTPTGVGHLPPQRGSNPFRNQLKGISPSAPDSTRSLSTSTTMQPQTPTPLRGQVVQQLMLPQDTADESQSQPSFPQAPIQVHQSTPISNTGAGSSQMPGQSFQPPLAGQGQGNTQRTSSNAHSSAPLTSHMSTSGSQKTPNIPMDTSHSHSHCPTTNPFQSLSTSGAQPTGQPSGAQRGGQPLDNNGTISAGMSLEEISQAISGRILELMVAQLLNTGQRPRKSDIAFGLPFNPLQDDIRKLTNKLMGWNRDEQPYAIPPAGPTKQELDDFVMGQTSGPTADNFRLDLRKLSKDHEERNLQKRWNNRASVVFAREFLRLCEGNRWGYTVDSQRESFLAQRFADKLRRLKDIHQLQSRLSVATEQDRYRILKEQQDGQKPDRHWACRVELFEFRKCLLEFHKDVPSAYMDVLLMLGVDGMSSEDTDPQSRVKPYKFYRIPKVWRSAHIDLILYIIDKLYAHPNILGANQH
ncbi:hypothetical protein M422DRAFT_248668 [Sphaerobolus stellatus SS14]|nr:hypothetical protein M422DRAFT_248668 [Sphaerobolus stellatus SS14]